MPLNQPALTQDLLRVFSDVEQQPPQIASALANAYQTYALTGLFGTSTFTPTNLALLQQSLLSAIQNAQTGNPAQFAQAWMSGLTSYWLTPPVAIAGAQVGVVTSIIGIAAVAPALTALFSNVQATAQSTAQGLSNVLDKVSRTVQGTVAPPPATLVFLI